MPYRILTSLAVLACTLGLLVAAGAQETARTTQVPAAGSNGDWSALTPAQRAALAPLQRDWPTIDENRRRKWLDLATRFPKMPPDEQRRVQARMTQWARLSPDERGRTRLQFQESLRASPDAQDRQARWEAYQALTPEQRQALAERSRGKPASAAAPGRPAATRPEAKASAASGDKRNTVGLPPRPPSAGREPVTPTAVQARPGATTTLMSAPPAPPSHHQPGLPKIAATPNFVDPATLLPRRGAQGAGVVGVPPAASGAAR